MTGKAEGERERGKTHTILSLCISTGHVGGRGSNSELTRGVPDKLINLQDQSDCTL